MDTSRDAGLEILAQAPQGTPRDTPLLFIHGAYTAAWCWAEHFLPFFAARGYASYALSLSGHGGSRGRDHLDTLSIADYVRDVREAAARLPAPPVLIGHSMGGLVVQKLLEDTSAPAAVLMCAVPPQGLWASAVGLVWRKPGLFADLNRLLGGGRAALHTLGEALFAQPVDAQALQAYYRRMQPESHRAIWDMTLFDLPRPHRVPRIPMLVLGAEHDHLIPTSQVALTARAYGVDAEIFDGMGHGLMLERDWQRVAERIAAWLGEHGL